jgi:hypothetical protein
MGPIAAACSEEGYLVVIYTPRGSRIELDLSPLRDGVRPEWFNPRSGARMYVTGDRPV